MIISLFFFFFFAFLHSMLLVWCLCQIRLRTWLVLESRFGRVDAVVMGSLRANLVLSIVD